MTTQKKIVIPANGPGPHKEMAKRVKAEFAQYPSTLKRLEERVLAIIKEYDIADAMRGFEGRDK